MKPARIRYTDRFDDPNLPGEMQTTITLKKSVLRHRLNVVQEGVPEVVPAEACYVGWQESLILLAKLVEPEILDQASPIALDSTAEAQRTQSGKVVLLLPDACCLFCALRVSVVKLKTHWLY